MPDRMAQYVFMVIQTGIPAAWVFSLDGFDWDDYVEEVD